MATHSEPYDPATGSRHDSLSTGSGGPLVIPTYNRAHTLRRAVRMLLVGGNKSVRGEGVDLQPGISSYFHGNNPSKWRSGVPHYAKVRYRNVYDGIDLVYYGNQSGLEYDFVVSPGADPHAIRMRFDGVTSLRIDDRGNATSAVLGSSRCPSSTLSARVSGLPTRRRASSRLRLIRA